MRYVKVGIFLSITIAFIFIAAIYVSIKDSEEDNDDRNFSWEQDAKADENVESSQSSFLSWKGVLLSPLNCCIRSQGMSVVVTIVYCQNVEYMLLSISNLPRGNEQILSHNIYARNVSIKYQNENRNN